MQASASKCKQVWNRVSTISQPHKCKEVQGSQDIKFVYYYIPRCREVLSNAMMQKLHGREVHRSARKCAGKCTEVQARVAGKCKEVQARPAELSVESLQHNPEGQGSARKVSC